MKTRHTPVCRMSFGRPKPETGCPRCVELSQGAPARTWNAGNRMERKRSEEIRRHNCHTSGCGPVCTAFDW